VAIYCVNAACPEQLVRRVEYFVGRSAMDIDNFGSQTAALLIEEGLIKEVADIYFLQRQDLLELEGFQEKKVDNLLNGIDASKAQPATRVLTAMGIRFVGGVVAGLLLDALGSIDRIASASLEELEEIEGIGPETAAAVIAWFQQPTSQKLLEKLRLAGLNFAVEDQESQSVAFEGMTFVITGTLPGMIRSEAKSFIESHGGKVTGSVSRRTSYLLAGEAAGSKLDKANELGIPVIDEASLLQLAEEG
jgi:DNA ligase (NAD+)